MAEKVPSLVEFAFEERKADCPFCQLPEEVRRQIVAAAKKRITRETIFRYLKQHFNFSPDNIDDAYTTHNNGHHDRKLRELKS